MHYTNTITMLKQIRRYAYKDNEDYYNKIKIKAGYQPIHIKKFEETQLYKYLKECDYLDIRRAVLFIMLGRDYSRYYGGVRGLIRPIEYLEYLSEQRKAMNLDINHDIAFILKSRLEVVSYIDRVLKMLREE